MRIGALTIEKDHKAKGVPEFIVRVEKRAYAPARRDYHSQEPEGTDLDAVDVLQTRLDYSHLKALAAEVFRHIKVGDINEITRERFYRMWEEGFEIPWNRRMQIDGRLFRLVPIDNQETDHG